MSNGSPKRLFLALGALACAALLVPGTALADESVQPRAQDRDGERAANPVGQVAQADPAATTPAEPGTENAGDEAVDALEVASDDDSAADATVEETVEEGGDSKSWSVGANTSISVGIGSFIPQDEGGKARVRWTMGFSGSYKIPVIDVGIGARTSFSQWLTRGGGSQEPQEFRFGDIGLNLSRAIYTIPVVNINISGAVGFTIPTSTFSRNTDLYTTIAPSLSFAWQLGGLKLSYSFGYHHNFHEATSTTYDPSDVDILSRQGGNEILSPGQVAAGGVLGELGISNAFNISYSFLESFSVALGFSFSDQWSYDNGTITQDDEFVAENADVGRVHNQATSGSLRFSYAPIDYLSMSLSLSSSQPWKTADNQGFRFPFFDFESPQNNFTYLGFGLAGSY